jgi:hypothetical protein
MSEITVDIQSLTDEELSDALRIRGAQYGPIGREQLFNLCNE